MATPPRSRGGSDRCPSRPRSAGSPSCCPRSASSSSRSSTTLRRTFELHGFANIETRSVEPLDRCSPRGRDRQGDLRPAAAAGRATRRTGDAGLGLHFDLTVPFARYVLENAGQLAVPVPPLPDPAGLARRAPAGGPLPRVHAGRHRHRRPGTSCLPPRRRGDAGDGGGAGRAPDPAGVLPVQQPQADPGLLPRPRHRRRHRGDPGHRQARQAAGRGGRAPARRERGRDAEQADRCLQLATIREPTPPSSSGSAPSGSSDELLETGLAELAAVVEGCAGADRRPGRRRGEPAHRARPRLLHRHGLRDLHGRLRAPEVRRLAAAGTTRSPTTAARRTRASASRFGVSRTLRAADRRRRARRQPVGAQRGAGRRRPTRSRAAEQRRRRAAAARARHPVRGRAQPAEVRQADPVRRAARHPVRLVPPAESGTATRSRTSAAATRSPPIPDAWTPPDRPTSRPTDRSLKEQPQ